MLHKRCNMDILGVLLIYPHSPSGAARPWDRVYISVKPLAAVLQPINVLVYLYFSWCDWICIQFYAILRIHNPGVSCLINSFGIWCQNLLISVKNLSL